MGSAVGRLRSDYSRVPAATVVSGEDPGTPPAAQCLAQLHPSTTPTPELDRLGSISELSRVAESPSRGALAAHAERRPGEAPVCEAEEE